MRALFVRLGLLAPRHTFALLDAKGICRAFHEGCQAPHGHDWVKVREARLHWLGRTLPASALAPMPGQRAALSRAVAG